MKKIFLFAAAAALLTACSSEELAGTESAQQKVGEAPINFSIYTPRSVTRAGAPLEITDALIKDGTSAAAKAGFGIMAYYTDDEKYDAEKSTPNFMYNTQVVYNNADGKKKWEYNPVMYWPNEFGKKANSAAVDRVSFFAYAPYVEVEPTSGIPYKDQANWKTDKTLIDTNEKNIVFLSKNTDGGDPIVKYIVDTNPSTSVDLLWGVAGKDYADDTDYNQIKNGEDLVDYKKGKAFIDLVKPNDPAKDKVNFNLRHALSKLNVNVKYVADAPTTEGSPKVVGTTPATAKIKPEQTRIYIRSISIGGFVMKAALDLNNKNADDAYWKDFDGKSTLTPGTNTKFFDGRKDGKEGTETGENPNESYTGLNPKLVENYVNDVWGGTGDWTKKTVGVTDEAQNLFGDGNALASEPIYVIPVDNDIDIEIEYDVLTADENLSDFLSDGLTHGSMIKNIIRKTSKEIFGTSSAVQMEDNKAYTINIVLGMTSVKIEANVTPWVPETATANLPDNQY